MSVVIRYTHDGGVVINHTDKQGFVATVELSWRDVEELEKKRLEQKGK